MAKAVKQEVSIPVIAANLIRSAQQAEDQLLDNIQDFVALGRPMIADPHWTQKVFEGREKAVKRCVNCLYCFESMQNNAFKGTHGKCSVNPMLGRESDALKINGEGRTVVIVGAGPGGMTAAETLAKRGFKTIVLEQSDEVGGQIMLAKDVPFKEKLLWCPQDLYNAALAAGAEIKLSTKADKELIESFSPTALIIATGGSSVKPKSIPGVGLPNVCTVTEVLNGTVSLSGKKVAVIGSGMTGLETSELLAEQGNDVFVVEMAKTIAPGTWMQHIDDIMPRLKASEVEIFLSKKLVAIHRTFIELESTGIRKEKTKLECDQVVLSIGVKSENALYNEMKESFENIQVIGDACKSGRIAQATESGYLAAIAIE